GCQDDDRGAVTLSRPAADMGRIRFLGKQRQRGCESAVAPHHVSALASRFPGDRDGRRRIGVGDATGKRGQKRFVSPAMREQLGPPRRHSDQQVERVSRGGGADNPDRPIGSLFWHWVGWDFFLYRTQKKGRELREIVPV